MRRTLLILSIILSSLFVASAKEIEGTVMDLSLIHI